VTWFRTILVTVRRRAHGDEGMSLVELIVYMVLTVLLGGLVATTFINGQHAQARAKSLADASNEGQLAVAQIEQSIRNGWPAKVPLADAGFGNNLLIVKTRVGDDGSVASSWNCQAFYYDSATKAIYRWTTPATVTSATLDLQPGFSLVGWKKIIGDVIEDPDAVGSPPIFRNGGDYGAYNTVAVNFAVTTNKPGTNVSISTSVYQRPQGDADANVSCWND